MITIKTYGLGANFFSIDLPKGAKILKVHTPFGHRPQLYVLINTNSTKMETRNFLSATVDKSYSVDIKSLKYLGFYSDRENLFEIIEEKLFK